jgi:hypothetical protein
VGSSQYLELRRFCLIFCSCSSLVFSSLTGLGMNPTSQPSFTRRPIHQSLLYFCTEHTDRQTSQYHPIIHTPVFSSLAQSPCCCCQGNHRRHLSLLIDTSIRYIYIEPDVHTITEQYPAVFVKLNGMGTNSSSETI